MPFPTKDTVDAWKKTWTDRKVTVKPGHPELTRFEGKTGRVVTVSYSGRAIVEFGDGSWVDIADFETILDTASLN
ncbi:hypothetical protein BH11PLA2_BH11PLA2_33420 [soil metagenome]